MSYQIRVSARAAAQIRRAADWWTRNRSKAPEAFADEVERGFDLLCSLPSTGEPVAHSRLTDVRRILLGRVRYYLYYQVLPEAATVEVLALGHTSREEKPRL